MVDPRRHAAALLAVFALLSPASALAQSPTPTPESQPPLTDEIPKPDDPDEGTSGGDEGESSPDTESTEPLADTGLDAGLVALLGLGLIASGSGLRVSLGRGD